MTLHKLDEFLNGEIHEEMNQGLEIKRSRPKIRKFKLMNTLKLLNDGSDSLKLNDIRTNKLDSEILLSNVLK